MNGMKEMNEIRGMSRLGPMLARLGFVGSFFFETSLSKKKAFGPRIFFWLANKKVGSFFFSKSFFSKKVLKS